MASSNSSALLIRLWIVLGLCAVVLMASFFMKRGRIDTTKYNNDLRVIDSTLIIEKEMPQEIIVDVDSLIPPPDTLLNLSVTATFYNPVPSQTDGSPNKTATGYKIDLSNPFKHRIIAISRDIEQRGIRMGDSVIVIFEDGTKSAQYNGKYVVQDRMHHKQRNKIDLLVSPDMYMGLFKGVRLIKIEG